MQTPLVPPTTPSPSNESVQPLKVIKTAEEQQTQVATEMNEEGEQSQIPTSAQQQILVMNEVNQEMRQKKVEENLKKRTREETEKGTNQPGQTLFHTSTTTIAPMQPSHSNVVLSQQEEEGPSTKRLKEDEQREKNLEQPEPFLLPTFETTTTIAQSTSTGLIERMKSCFPAYIQGLDLENKSPQEIAKIANQLALRRLSQPTPLTEGEITQIHHLFSSTELSNHILLVQDPVHLNPPAIFANLFNCYQAMHPYTSCDAAMKAINDYYQGEPKPALNIQQVLNLPKDRQENVLNIIKGEAEKGDENNQNFLKQWNQYHLELANFQEGLKQFPLALTQQIFSNTNNLNEVYVLRDTQRQIKWIFKPEDGLVNKANMGQVEHTASLVNFHGKFPIPITVYIQFKERTGSAQCYIEGAQQLEDLNAEKLQLVSELDVQKLVLYDLLFCNSDRHNGNILGKPSTSSSSSSSSSSAQTATSYRLYGIDHDQCMMAKDIRDLKLDYQSQFPGVFQRKFSPALADLVSEESQKKYVQIMLQQGIDRQAIKWTQDICLSLRSHMGKASIGQIVNKTKKVWEKKFLS
jgi:hypothetical protein